MRWTYCRLKENTLKYLFKTLWNCWSVVAVPKLSKPVSFRFFIFCLFLFKCLIISSLCFVDWSFVFLNRVHTGQENQGKNWVFHKVRQSQGNFSGKVWKKLIWQRKSGKKDYFICSSSSFSIKIVLDEKRSFILFYTHIISIILILS